VLVMLAAGAPTCRSWFRRLWRGAGQVASAEEFAEFAEVMFPRLRRTAFLLCGDWHAAEDLAQTTLAKMFVAWRGVRRDDGVHAYANRTLVNTYLAQRRLKRAGELLTAWFPDRAAPAPALETRMVVLDALATLPPRARAVVVLRYWADLSVEQVADVLGCSSGNVKSLTARALHRLRVVLGEAMRESGPPVAAEGRTRDRGTAGG
jgi:RNA polymerase sigma-70 factor (sigma-E family)